VPSWRRHLEDQGKALHENGVCKEEHSRTPLIIGNKAGPAMGARRKQASIKGGRHFFFLPEWDSDLHWVLCDKARAALVA
jgi:hypothetical protein